MRGAISRKRHRPTENTEFSSEYHILHSTPVNGIMSEFAPPTTPGPSQIVITAPTGFPYFTATLQENGFFVVKPRNHLQVDQLVFRQSLSRFLRDSNADGRNLFIKELEGYLRISENLFHSMTPTLHPDEVLQESLFRNFLHISELHRIAMNALLPAIMEISCIASTQQDIDNLEAMLVQLRWIEYASCDAFLSFIIGTIESATNAGKLVLLKFLPDIIPERQHSKLLSTLKDMLETADSPIVSAIMECLSSLDISTAEWADNRTYAITQLMNAPLQDFPAYFAFLFKTEDVLELSEIIAQMRESLEIVPLGGSEAKNAISMVELVEKIRFCASFNPHLVSAWIKQVKDDLESGDVSRVKPLDLIMILIFSESFKETAAILKQIWINVNLTKKLLDHMILHNLPILSQVCKTLIKFCDTLLWNPKDSRAHPGVKYILVKLFTALSPLEIELIGSNLICILMNGDTAARGIALKIFTDITSQHSKKLLPFAQQLMGVLEGSTTCTTDQIRELMSILACLAHIEGSIDSERFGSQYTILLRKYLTHSNPQNRCLGVIGALATVNQLSVRGKENDANRVQELLSLSWSYVKREEDSCCLFFDELSQITRALSKDITIGLRERLTKSFLKSWSHSADNHNVLEKLRNKQCNLEMVEQFIVDVLPDENMEGDDRKILIFEERPLGLSPRGIPAHARLLFRLIAQKTDLNELLTSSLFLPDINIYYKIPANMETCTLGQRKHLGFYLLMGINFLRECISAFVDEKNEIIQIYVWYRLYNMICLQKLLIQNFQHFIMLPTAYITARKMTALGGDGASTSTDFKKPKFVTSDAKGKGKKKKKKEEGDEAKEIPDINLASTLIQPPEISSHLRKLDPEVFALLGAPLKLHSAINFDAVWDKLRDGTINRKQILNSVAQLYPDALSLLLLEINQRGLDPENSFCLLHLDDLIKWITRHLETIISEFENSSQMRGIRKSEECLQLIFNTLSSYCEKVVKLMDSVEREKYYEKILTGLTISAGLDEDVSEEDQIVSAVSFLKRASVCVKKSSRAFDHLKAFSSFQALFPDNEVASSAVVNIAESYMNSHWTLSSLQVDFMLKARVLKSSEPMTVMRSVTASIIDPEHEDLSCCTPGNFHSFYSVLFQLLSQYVAKNGKKAIASGDGVTFWKDAVLMFKDLVFVADTHRQRNILTPLLKHSRTFIESYTTTGTSLLPTMYQNSINEFKKFVRNLQLTTRKLQVVCEHSKVQKDTKLMRSVPQLKRALECLVFRVLELFTGNNISDAFGLGSLRHRTLDGEEFNSQPFNQTERERNENGDEGTDEDDDNPVNENQEESEVVRQSTDSDSEEVDI